MVDQALTLLDIQSEDKVLDLFCGLGNFSLPLARKAAQVTGVEGSDAMVEQASANAAANNIENCRFSARTWPIPSFIPSGTKTATIKFCWTRPVQVQKTLSNRYAS
ncbi:methyltransferase domain-containing protein [Aliamphritea spongicola]